MPIYISILISSPLPSPDEFMSLRLCKLDHNTPPHTLRRGFTLSLPCHIYRPLHLFKWPVNAFETLLNCVWFMRALIYGVYRPHGCIGLGQTLGDEFACKLYRLYDGNQNQHGNHHRACVKTLVAVRNGQITDAACTHCARHGGSAQ